MFEELKENLQREKKIVADIISINASMQTDPTNRGLYMSSLGALRDQLILLNNSVPQIINEWTESETKAVEVKAKPKEQQLSKISYAQKEPIEERAVKKVEPQKPALITISKKDKKELLKKMKFSDEALGKIVKIQAKESNQVFVKPSEYARLSNKMFRKTSDKLSPQFTSLGQDLKKSNSQYMLTTYLSMAIFSILLAFVIGTLIFVGLLALTLDNWRWVFLPLGFAGLVLAAFYMYPASVASSVQKKISQELPFASIHMAAVASSNIEPTKIFKIIAKSADYPNIAKELRKVIAQIDIYGYDMVVALKNVAKRTSNKDLAELFSGLATNVATGGALKNYLGKKAESLLANYRLERQKYAAMAGTFMDVYISILIAAPLIMMMMFIVMSVAGLGVGGLSINMLMTLAVIGIGFVNVIFLVVLTFKQPSV